MENKITEYAPEDARVVIVAFFTGENGVTVRETFEAENELAAEQLANWIRQASELPGDELF